MIRYDNRDCGLSTKFDGQHANLDAITARLAAGDLVGAKALAPYTLGDMANDGLDLLTALQNARAAHSRPPKI